MKRIVTGTLLTLVCLAAPSAARANGIGFGFKVNTGFYFSITPYFCDNSCPPPCYGFGPCFAPAYSTLGYAPPPAFYYDAASGMARPYQNPAAACYAPSYPYGAGGMAPPPQQPPSTTQRVGYYPPYGAWYGR